MIETTAGQQFEALIGDMPAGLAGTANLTFGVIRTDGTRIFEQTSAGITEVDAPSGTYRTLQFAPAAGTYLVEWVVQGTKYMEDLKVDAEPPAVVIEGAYPASLDLLAGMTGEAHDAFAALTPDQQDAIRSRAISDIERFCGQSFTPWYGIQTIDGHGGNEEYLPMHLEQLDAISLVGITLGPFVPDLSSVDVSADGGRVVIRPLLAGGGYAVRAMYPEGYEYQRHFPEGPDTIQLTGAWGWSEVPNAVVDVLRNQMGMEALLDANELTSTVRLYRRMGLTSIAQGNLRATLGGGSAAGGPVPSGIDIEDQARLEPFIWHGRQGFVI